jgi:hypothetical protein
MPVVRIGRLELALLGVQAFAAGRDRRVATIHGLILHRIYATKQRFLFQCSNFYAKSLHIARKTRSLIALT